jgi:hypothetical protein
LVVLDVVNDAVLANTNSALTGAARELNATLRSRFRREGLYSFLESLLLSWMNLAERFRCGRFVDDRVAGHRGAVRCGSETELGHQFFVRDSALLTASGDRGLRVPRVL